MIDGLEAWLWEALPPTEWEQTETVDEQAEADDDCGDQEDT